MGRPEHRAEAPATVLMRAGATETRNSSGAERGNQKWGEKERRSQGVNSSSEHCPEPWPEPWLPGQGILMLGSKEDGSLGGPGDPTEEGLETECEKNSQQQPLNGKSSVRTTGRKGMGRKGTMLERGHQTGPIK